MSVPNLVLALACLMSASTEDPASSSPKPTPTPIAFVDMNVIPMDQERVLAHHTVLVRGDEIQTVGPTDRTPVPAGAMVIDGKGQDFLMPGLVDTHAHFEDDVMSPLFLIHGVTTVINLRGNPEIKSRRDRILAGEELGPTIYTSGPFVNEPEVKTPEQAEQAVREQHDEGYELIKIHGELARATYERLIEVGKEYEIPVIGHAPRSLSFEAVLEVGQVWIVHAEEMIYTYFQDLDVQRIPELVPRIARSGLWLTPTLSTFAAITRQWGRPQVIKEAHRHRLAAALGSHLWSYWENENPYTGREITEWPEKAYRFQIELVRQLHAAGVRLMAGTDTPLPLMFPGDSLQEELDEMKRCGLTTFDALATATRNPGEFVRDHVHPDAFFGTIAPLMRADLLVLAGNPLDDLHRTASPKGVLVRGRWLDTPQLKSMLAALEAQGTPATHETPAK